jgi:hypothetical protein
MEGLLRHVLDTMHEADEVYWHSVECFHKARLVANHGLHMSRVLRVYHIVILWVGESDVVGIISTQDRVSLVLIIFGRVTVRAGIWR